MKTKDKEKSLESSKREMLPYLQGKKKTIQISAALNIL